MSCYACPAWADYRVKMLSPSYKDTGPKSFWACKKHKGILLELAEHIPRVEDEPIKAICYPLREAGAFLGLVTR